MDIKYLCGNRDRSGMHTGIPIVSTPLHAIYTQLGGNHYPYETSINVRGAHPRTQHSVRACAQRTGAPWQCAQAVLTPHISGSQYSYGYGYDTRRLRFEQPDPGGKVVH